MSGHSKWANIAKRKGAQDAKKANVFTKLARNITVAAQKGSDPDMNFSLRLAIDKARSASMPKDNIERAIAKASGTGDGARLEQMFYEVFGPEGIGILVEALTDNKNRTTSEIRAILNKYGGTLAAANAVKWMFKHQGVIRVGLTDVENKDALTLELELIDAGADDVVEEENGLTIYSSFENFEKVKKFVEQKGLVVDYAEMEWVAKDKVEKNEESNAKIEKLVDMIEEKDDVSGVYTNIA
ncbi:YebC/PmpR family DNA-binding transcriptional regulator [Candidatus Falkowbacteria bacterium]|nr:YebC/PmpR family DNA-binding transcriptional regulator [Candidatus Falkowbacteria bacterium]